MVSGMTKHFVQQHKSVIAEHFVICKFGIKAHFIAPVPGSPITLGFYAVLLYPMLKTEAQRSEMRLQLPSTPGKN